MKAKTTVVNVKHSTCDVYIGRAIYGNRGFCGRAIVRKPSKWANPFHITPTCSRVEAIAKYEQMVRGRPDLMDALLELAGKRLGCWCAPLPCHGDILVKLIEETKAR